MAYVARWKWLGFGHTKRATSLRAAFHGRFDLDMVVSVVYQVVGAHEFSGAVS